MNIQAWHSRYVLQALWTAKLRQFLLNQVNARPGEQILEVGSGTGALFPDFESRGLRVVGLDYKPKRCQYSLPYNSRRTVICGNAYDIPAADHSFDLSVCHYLLLWLKEPERALAEMARVTKQGRHIIAFAEPDYQSRIDYPEIFQKIGEVQNRSLEFQGVDLSIGRRMGAMFRSLGLKDVNVGLLAGEWKEPSPQVFDAEWDIIAYDLGGLAPVDEILAFKAQARETWLSGQACVFIPTFYAYGMV